MDDMGAGHFPTRAELVRAGLLVDVPAEDAAQAGLAVPVGFSPRAWALYAPDGESGHLGAVLSAVVDTIAQMPGSATSATVFGLRMPSGVVPGLDEELRMEVHPDDAGDPALMLLVQSDYGPPDGPDA
ncbi:hypothetical protein ACIRO1_29720 [Streptomyces sp. NPDC102381]|uniref:hypothetical protein n=1 Tax=Streptomyces sp. NPDC102381 TaxID=3366164 RepID=UPI00382E531B